MDVFFFFSVRNLVEIKKKEFWGEFPEFNPTILWEFPTGGLVAIPLPRRFLDI